MDITKFIEDWISVSNSYDTEKYLEFYHTDTVLDDPSVGRKFLGKQGVKEYFENYFIEYKTHAKKIAVVLEDETHAHLELEFTGVFSEGKLGGTFDLVFKDGKIIFAKADLI